MKSYREQVDSLIEGLMDGSLITIFTAKPNNTILDYMQRIENTPRPVVGSEPLPKPESLVSAMGAFLEDDHEKELDKIDRDDWNSTMGAMILSFAYFVDNVAREYMKASEEKKNEMAETIFHQALKYLVFGLITKDPNMTKFIAQERDLYKAQVQSKQEIIDEYEKQLGIKRASALPPEKDGFTAFG